MLSVCGGGIRCAQCFCIGSVALALVCLGSMADVLRMNASLMDSPLALMGSPLALLGKPHALVGAPLVGTIGDALDYMAAQPSSIRVRALVALRLAELERAYSLPPNSSMGEILLLHGYDSGVLWGLLPEKSPDPYRVKGCSVPCTVTKDRTSVREASGVIFSPVTSYFDPNVYPLPRPPLPVIMVTQENYFHFRMAKVLRGDAGKTAQSWPGAVVGAFIGGVPAQFLSSYELDSHVPIPYGSGWVNEFRNLPVQSREKIIADFSRRQRAVMVVISNKDNAPMMPNRVELWRQVHEVFPVASYGHALMNATLRRIAEKSGFSKWVEGEKYMFGNAMENSYGMDYVTEKVYDVFKSGGIPIYAGALNVGDFLPHRDAVIHVRDFASALDLATYLNRLSNDPELAYERHLSWRTVPLPQHIIDIARLNTEFNPLCSICHCFAGNLESCRRASPPPPLDSFLYDSGRKKWN
jgi:hypothetical protein